MEKSYRFTISGSGANNQTWETTGMVQCEFHDAFNLAMQESFQNLTQGRATYGNPGVGGCRGPYDVTRVLIEQMKH